MFIKKELKDGDKLKKTFKKCLNLNKNICKLALCVTYYVFCRYGAPWLFLFYFILHGVCKKVFLRNLGMAVTVLTFITFNFDAPLFLAAY